MHKKRGLDSRASGFEIQTCSDIAKDSCGWQKQAALLLQIPILKFCKFQVLVGVKVVSHTPTESFVQIFLHLAALMVKIIIIINHSF